MSQRHTGSLTALLFLAATLAPASHGAAVLTAGGPDRRANPAVTLSNGTTIRVIKRIDVNLNPKRDLHGPCVVREANGDLLLGKN